MWVLTLTVIATTQDKICYSDTKWKCRINEEFMGLTGTGNFIHFGRILVITGEGATKSLQMLCLNHLLWSVAHTGWFILLTHNPGCFA